MIKVKLKKELHGRDGRMDLDVDFHMPAQEFLTVFGPSGSGKTSIVRMIAGLMRPDEGFIEVDGDVWFDSQRGINVPVQQRAIGFVFQEYGLFPNMTVRQNLQYALKDPGDAGQIDGFLRMVDLEQFGDRRPANLSGGQKQRLAFVRALLRRPKIFLIDESFSALDIKLRLKLQDEVLEMHNRFKVPTIFVTHDLGEIFKLAQRILILEEGRIVRSGPPRDVFGEDALSGTFKLAGSIIDLEPEDLVHIVTVQIGHNLTKVIATREEASQLRVGDRVLVSLKAFNPILVKV